MPDRPLTILFLCTGNSARSILAEALLNHLGDGRIVALSAATECRGAQFNRCRALLEEAGIATAHLRSESAELCAGAAALAIDLMVAPCARPRRALSGLPGAPASVHWGLSDPSAVEGSDAERREAFERAWSDIEGRVRLLVALPEDELDRQALAREFGAVHARFQLPSTATT